jgi:pimeloyl-ACP methyl ester carboxylesterase
VKTSVKEGAGVQHVGDEDHWPRVRSRHVSVSGASIHVREEGAGGDVVLLLPGSGMSWRIWQPQIPALRRRFRLLLPDLRGHGDSDRAFPHNRYDARLQARDLVEVLDSYEVRAAHVVGVSQGAVVAQLLAATWPERVRRLVVADSYSEIPTATSERALQVANVVTRLLPMPVIKLAALAPYARQREVRRTLRRSWAIDKRELLALKTAPFPDHTDELSRIQAPTLVLAGDRVLAGADEVRAARILVEHIPDARGIVYAGAFDPVTLMRARDATAAILAFLDGRALPHAARAYPLDDVPER